MKKPSRRKWTTFLILLLAVLCIGAAELAASYWYDPPLYHTVTAPAVRTAHAAADLCMEGVRRLGAAMERIVQHTVETAQSLEEAARRSQEELERIQAQRMQPKPSAPIDTVPPEEPASEASAPAEVPLTELHTENGRDILTGGVVDIVYFNQSEEPWADAPYGGTDTLRKYGCGPTVMAMVVASLTDKQTDPALMAQWAVEHGHWASQNGSYHSIVSGAAAAFGLQAEFPVEQTVQSLRDTLESGKLLVALVGPGHFTQFGHFILLRGITPDGDILVADPNSVPNSLAVWSPQLILDELAHSNSSGAPLWAISPLEA